MRVGSDGGTARVYKKDPRGCNRFLRRADAPVKKARFLPEAGFSFPTGATGYCVTICASPSSCSFSGLTAPVSKSQPIAW